MPEDCVPRWACEPLLRYFYNMFDFQGLSQYSSFLFGFPSYVHIDIL